MSKLTPAKAKIRPSDINRLISKVGQEIYKDKIATMTEEEVAEVTRLFDEWEPGTAVTLGMFRYYSEQLYECVQAHTTQSDWTPDVTPALWTCRSAPGVIPDWIQPTGAQDSYQIGDQVMYDGQIWESLIDANTWSPASYPAGWRVVE